MAELVGGALLSSFLQVAFDRLASRQVLDFIRGRKLDEKKLKKLKLKLRSINAVADDAELKQFTDPLVKEWLADAKDAVFQAEDLFDEIYELSKCKVEDESQSAANKMWNSVKSSFSAFENEIESRMEQLLDEFDDLASQSVGLGLERASGVGVGSGLGSKVTQRSQTTSVAVESVIYGRDHDKEEIANWLTSDTDNKLSILSIVGMGGLGKTTLAQHAYNDPRIEGKFDIKAWVCVSDDFDVFKLTRTILEAVTKSTDDSRDLQMVHERLEKNLKGKKFLLVLDDVWNEKREEWEALQAPLVNFGAQGSRILVTTRSKKVASSMRSKEHGLEQLQEDYCWQLFAKHAFQDDNSPPNPDFKEIGMKIVKKCKGLPLALKSMGSLLHNNSSPLEWKSVLQSELWDLEGNNIIPALALSYHHLPSHLKRCFAYCALFPKDYLFDKEGLIQLWMAENFLLCHQHRKSPEEVGEQYFNDLLSRSFFQQSSYRFETWFVMHDLINDLAKYVCGDICIRLGVDNAKGIPITTRHFSFSAAHGEYFDGFGSLHDPQRLHTFMPTTEGMNDYYACWNCRISIDDLLSKFKFLRILSLSGCSELGEVLDSVGNLIHLRSLDLSNTNIEKLPESTCSLYNMQILKLNNCLDLKELPSNLHELTHLRRLELMETEVKKVPAYLGKLENLQVVMSSFVVGQSREFSIQQFGELNLHGKLSIGKLQNIENPSDASTVDLENKTHLVNLGLKWDADVNLDDSTKDRHENVIENLRPSKRLEGLSIWNYGGKQFPRWLSDNSLSNVASLRLDGCLYCQRLPSLGLLPFLKDLKISMLDGIMSIDTDFYGSSSSSFASLETLEFSRMFEWENWECQGVTGAFPRLQHLSLLFCRKLKGHLPEHLLHLQTLQIWGCEQLVASAPNAPEICKLELRDCGKVQFDYHLTALKDLTIDGISMETSKFVASLKGDNWGSNTSLERLFIGGMDAECFPDEGMLPLSLTCLEISACRDLKQLDYRGLCHLSSLKKLYLWECPLLKCLPEEGLPKSISTLRIWSCPLLKQRCQEPEGEDWPKIAHIEDVELM